MGTMLKQDHNFSQQRNNWGDFIIGPNLMKRIKQTEFGAKSTLTGGRRLTEIVLKLTEISSAPSAATAGSGYTPMTERGAGGAIPSKQGYG